MKQIVYAVICWLLKIREYILLGKRSSHNANDEFTKSLCILLSGMRAATSRHVVSATLAHLIVSQNGTRFTFSHDFGHLLVTRLEATLEGNPVNVCVRTTKVDREMYFLPNSSSKDYIRDPTSLKGLCSYKMICITRSSEIQKCNQREFSWSSTHNKYWRHSRQPQCCFRWWNVQINSNSPQFWVLDNTSWQSFY